MKYAVISDIHGNIHAFRAVIADAKAQGADMFLLLGDYAHKFPFGNEVITAIRGLDHAVAVRGNGEGYLTDLRGCNPLELTYEQYKPVYWAYRTVSAENFDYLASLPETAVVSEYGTDIYLAHSMSLFYRKPKILFFHSGSGFRKMMEEEPFTHEQYLVRAKEAVLACPEAVSEINAMPEGVYLFGHNHLQFYMEYNGRLFINPGSCGSQLDWNTRAAYTLLTLNETGWAVTERRVEYDLEQAAAGLVSSGFADYAPVWSEVNKLELFTAKDYFTPFVVHVVETGRNTGRTEYPVSNNIWEVAVKTWNAEKI